LQVCVVERNEYTVSTAVDVSFEVPVTQRNSVLESSERVFGCSQVAPAVRERDRTFVIEIRVAAHT
jgi:hypothetical protein